jgi:RNA polymerase sigma factor (sigma-70 family)
MTAQREQTILESVREYGSRLFRFIRGRVPTDADAEDVLQDVWLQLSNNQEVEAIENVSAWLYRVARNRLTDRSRKRREERLEDFTYETDEGEQVIRDLLLADYHTPETEHLRDLFWETLFSALDELPEAQRNAFVWNELEGETFQSIADRTGENVKTWISRKRYANRYLRAQLTELYEDLLNY